jgi:hypothetical protein
LLQAFQHFLPPSVTECGDKVGRFRQSILDLGTDGGPFCDGHYRPEVQIAPSPLQENVGVKEAHLASFGFKSGLVKIR